MKITEETFQNYKHYAQWISNNWDKTYKLNSAIVENNLVLERKYSCNGEPYRMLSKTEFEQQETIKIPKLC